MCFLLLCGFFPRKSSDGSWMYVVMLCCQECFMIPVIFVCVVYSNSQKTVLPNLRMTGPDRKGKMSITAEILDRTFTSGLQILCSSVFLA